MEGKLLHFERQAKYGFEVIAGNRLQMNFVRNAIIQIQNTSLFDRSFISI